MPHRGYLLVEMITNKALCTIGATLSKQKAIAGSHETLVLSDPPGSYPIGVRNLSFVQI
ncbi:MAG: hypothetical protein KF746_18640 [Chitinophagaceae bacterium]|nr:hypothetical protein [Chitinophagaceae bacterium]